MDWFSWLSRSNLDPSLIYDYGFAFVRNELQKEDLIYFNHEFLQSMGISVAKHRLEILKLARKEVGASPKSLSKFVLAISKTKKNFAKCINKWVFHQVELPKALPAPTGCYQEQWKGALTRKYKSGKELQVQVEKPILKTKRIAKSGPLDGRLAQEKLIVNNGTLKLSGPLDGRMAQEKLIVNNRSLKLSGPLDGRMGQEKLIVTNRTLKLSGPLDGNMQERSLKLSGPLDGNIQERLLFTYRSPMSSGPLDGRMYGNKSPKLSVPLDRRPPSPRIYTDYNKEKLPDGGLDNQTNTLWATLFQEIKPT